MPENDICPRCMELLKDGRCVNDKCGFVPRQRKPESQNRSRLPIMPSVLTPDSILELQAMTVKARAEFHVKLEHPRRAAHLRKYPMHRRWAVRVLWRRKLGDWRLPSVSIDMAVAALKTPGGHGGREHDWSRLKQILRNRELEFRERRKAENGKLGQQGNDRA